MVVTVCHRFKARWAVIGILLLRVLSGRFTGTEGSWLEPFVVVDDKPVL
jgi:hypothetical protein